MHRKALCDGWGWVWVRGCSTAVVYIMRVAWSREGELGSCCGVVVRKPSLFVCCTLSVLHGRVVQV